MKKTCSLINKSGGRVVYNIKDPDCYVRREIYPGQKIPNVKVFELEKLVQQPGGLKLFYNYLQIDDEEILQYLLNGGHEPTEYWLTEKQIPTWINTCSVDEFKDALDFAPQGTKDLIKQYSVSVPLKDYEKRQAVLDQLGFNVTAAIESQKTEDEQKEEAKEKAIKVAAAAQAGRRSTTTTIIKPTKKEDISEKEG